MALKKGGLGRGLDALFVENAAEGDGQPVTLRITEIEPNRGQPRKQFDEEALAELSSSIAQYGVLQPLLVRPLSRGGYQLVAGERRLRAARMAGLQEVPVVVREMDDKDTAAVALIENLQRQDLNPMEEAVGYRTLMDTYGLTQDETAQVVHKSRPAVANAMRLLNLPPAVGEMVRDGRVSAGHARALLSFSDEQEQLETARLAAENGWSVREVERRAKASRNPKKPSPAGKVLFSRDSFYNEVELSLSEQTGRRVRVTVSGEGGTLQIAFYSKEDLQELARRLAPDNG